MPTFPLTTHTPEDLESALHCSLRTLWEQPLEVPEAPKGWAARTQLALETEDSRAIEECAREIVQAHGQYPATFDRKGWLYVLRNLTIWASRRAIPT
jgi:hypothetical protein